MDFTEYLEAALKTALPTARNLDYLVPGLIAEIGECFGAVAKARRDEWAEDRLNAELVKEWGDCAWMVAVGLHDTNHSGYYSPGPIHTTRNGAFTAALGFALSANDDLSMPIPLVDLWRFLANNSEVVTGQPFDVVLETNLAKLADRANRAEIGGSGDAR